MNLRMSTIAALLAIGFVAGFAASSVAGMLSHAPEDRASVSLEDHRFGVNIIETKQAPRWYSFRGVFRRTVTLSDGARHDIELRPVLFPGEKTPYLKFIDNGKVVTHLGMGGSSSLDDGLMVSVSDLGGDRIATH